MEALYSDSEWESYSENSDSDDRYGNESMFGTHARSILSSLDASIRKIDDFLSIDSGFVAGDFVCFTSDQSRQIGRVVNVDMRVDLEDSYGQTITDVDGRKIIRICSFAIGDYVVNGPWLGKIEKVFDVVTVLFDDGSKCMVNGEDIENAHEDASFPHFLGQRVRMKWSTLFDTARKLCGGWDEATICQMEVGLARVNWLSPVIINSSPPNPLQDPKDLTLLLCHSHDSWQIGDWCKFRNPQEMTTKVGGKSAAFDRQYVITKMKTKFDILWQEGQRSEGVDSGDLLPVNVVDHDFWPGEIVLEKALNEDSGASESQRFGVVKSVNAKERMVKVNWISVVENATEEIVSAFELVEHPDYNYRLYEVVLRRLDTQIQGDSGYLSCIGNVVGLKDEEIEVRWADGVHSKVRCTDIYGLDRIPPSFVIPAENSVVAEENDQDKEEDLSVSSRKGFWNAEFDLLPRAATGILTDVIKSLFGQWHSYVLSSAKDSGFIDVSNDQLSVNTSSQVNGHEEDKIVHRANLENQESDAKTNVFKQFNFSEDYSDHHFINRVISVDSQVGSGWSKKIQQQWKVLEENLPDTIYVKVYEERMDLMRAVIIGAPGTPYHDGLFFFDLYFPPDYPHEPPAVHYHSGGLKLNPNLYESGKVCLSLLKTWTGTESEVWDPQKSTVLQLLLSLQALVLNDKPYFNEAGYERQVGSIDGERNAITYNENAFLLTCRSTLYHLKKSPKGFEAFVVDHFCRRSASILSACEAYMMEKNGSTESTGFKIMVGKLLPRLAEEFAKVKGAA